MSLSAHEFQERLSVIDTTLTLLEAELGDLQETLATKAISSIDTAKGNVTLAYSVALLTHGKRPGGYAQTNLPVACLQMRGCPKDHPIYKDLNRIKGHISKVRRAEEEASETSTVKKEPTMSNLTTF